MGMVMNITSLSDATIARLRESPPLVCRVLFPDEPEIYREEVGLPEGARVPLESLDHPEGVTWDLDKAWHGVHFLLCGAPDAGSPPMDFLVVGGDSIGEVDVGYGSARALAAADVADLHARCAALPDATLRTRFKPQKMMKLRIYPEIWDRDPRDDDTSAWLLDSVARLRLALAHGADHGLGMLIALQ